MFAIVLAGILGVLYFESLWEVIEGFLKINDSHRGIESGASGRGEVWAIVWALFLDNMITGISYRAHETVLGGSAHNGYLATMVEIGLIGFLSIMFIIFKGLLTIKKNLKVHAPHNYNPILFGFCLAYLFLALFERYMINVGNPASLLFIIAVLASTEMKNNENI